MAIVRAAVNGHVMIPVDLRQKFDIRKGSRVSVYEGPDRTIVVKPLPEDPIQSSKGMLKGKTSILKGLLKDRGNEVAL